MVARWLVGLLTLFAAVTIAAAVEAKHPCKCLGGIQEAQPAVSLRNIKQLFIDPSMSYDTIARHGRSHATSTVGTSHQI